MIKEVKHQWKIEKAVISNESQRTTMPITAGSVDDGKVH